MIGSVMAGYAALLGVMILCGVMLRLAARRRHEPSLSPPDTAQEHLTRLEEEEGMKGDIQELIVQLQEFSREVSAQIDARFAKLEIAIRSADERIATLEKLKGAVERRPTINALVSDEPDLQTRTGRAEVADPRRQLIYRLADSGRSAVQIAQETGQAPGEIELILGLRGKTVASQISNLKSQIPNIKSGTEKSPPPVVGGRQPA